MLTSNRFDDLISSLQLVSGMDVLFECRRSILWVMLCIVSWSQGLVMAKDPCEATITKRLAWLVEQLVVSRHEFYFILFWKLFLKSFSHFSIDVFTILWVHLCFIFFNILFSKPLLSCFHIAVSSPSPPTTCLISFPFLFFSFFNCFKQRRLVNTTDVNKNC